MGDLSDQVALALEAAAKIRAKNFMSESLRAMANEISDKRLKDSGTWVEAMDTLDKGPLTPFLYLAVTPKINTSQIMDDVRQLGFMVSCRYNQFLGDNTITVIGEGQVARLKQIVKWEKAPPMLSLPPSPLTK